MLILASVAFWVYQQSIVQSASETTRSNTHITDPVTTFDFVPLGVSLIQHPDGSLRLPDDPTYWWASNFAPFGMGTTADEGHSIIYHCGLNVQSGSKYRVSIDGGEWIDRYFEGKIYYDETGSKFGTGFPTVYAESGDYFAYVAYDEDTRTWFYKLNSPDGYVNATAKARSVPFWMGKANGPYVVQGLYGTHEDLDLWGGYVDMANVTTESNFGGVRRTYYGDMAMDREYHRQMVEGGDPGWKGCFSAMSLHSDEIDMAILQAVNPIDGSDNYEGIPFEHQGRINFFTRGKDYAFNDFHFSDDENIPPQRLHVEGSYEGGYVNLTAQTFKTFGWGPAKGVWWDADITRYWGRAFVLWNGEMTLNGEVIRIEDAFGFGEFTRVK